jgi:hypothetical protein
MAAACIALGELHCQQQSACSTLPHAEPATASCICAGALCEIMTAVLCFYRLKVSVPVATELSADGLLKFKHSLGLTCHILIVALGFSLASFWGSDASFVA